MPKEQPEALLHADGFRPEGLVDESGELLIEAPSHEMLMRIAQMPRVEYFPAQVPEGLREHVSLPLTKADVAEMQEYFRSNQIYQTTVIERLAERLREDMKGASRFGIRGTVLSLDGPVDLGDLHVKDIEQALRDGIDHGKDTTLIALHSDTTEQIHHRSAQWLEDGTQDLRASLSEHPELQKKLWPILFVYDLTDLTPVPNDQYGFVLPTEPEKRAKCILKAYVLDLPVRKKDI